MRRLFVLNQSLHSWANLRDQLVNIYDVPIEHIYRVPLFDTSSLSIAELCLLINSVVPKTIINDSLFDPIRRNDPEAGQKLRHRLSYFLTFIHVCQRIAEIEDDDEAIILSDRVITPTQKPAKDRLRTFLALGTSYLHQLVRCDDFALLCHEGISYSRLSSSEQQFIMVDGIEQPLFAPTAFPKSFVVLIKKNGAFRILHNLKRFESSLEEQLSILMRTGTLKVSALAYRLFRPHPGDNLRVPDTSRP